MKKNLLALLLSVVSLGAMAQDNGVPVGYKLEKPADYALYEKNVIQCIDWLIATP